MISDSLLHRQKPALLTAIITDPYILYQEVFTPTTIYPKDLCATSLRPPIPWDPAFDFVPPLPPKVTHPEAAQNIPPILLNTVPTSCAVSTVSVKSLSTTYQPLRKILPDQLRRIALLLYCLSSADGKIHSHSPAPCRHPPHTTRRVQHNTPKCMHPLPST